LKEEKRKNLKNKSKRRKAKSFSWAPLLLGGGLLWSKPFETHQLSNFLPFDHFHVWPTSFFSPIQCSVPPAYRFRKTLKHNEDVMLKTLSKYIYNKPVSYTLLFEVLQLMIIC
jgi:hypothetical protein